MFEKAKLYLNTIKHLEPKQFYWQLRYRLYRSKPQKYHNDIATSTCHLGKVRWPNKSAFIDQKNLCLLHATKAYQISKLWLDNAGDDLWVFNIHYFDYLNNNKVEDDLKLKLVHSWIDQVEHSSVAWQPYPTSLRVVNWIKWIINHKIKDQKILRSLYAQCLHLDKNIEYHILANHLFANIKALLIAGIFFENKQGEIWFDRYKVLLNKELVKQILRGGGHYELSPMYHNIILEDLLDILLFLKAYRVEIPHGFITQIKKMFLWSDAMSHPDQEVSFFNDSAMGIAQKCSDLKEYARAINVLDLKDHKEEVTDCDGYFVARRSIWDLKFDATDVCAHSQPGHTHADALSFELSVDDQRVFVNSGISTYHDLPLRCFQRSTIAHNTLSIDQKNSSQVWSKFRVASRSHILEKKSSTDGHSIIFEASHNGYQSISKPCIHKRAISIQDRSIVIEDTVTSRGKHEAHMYFYLHPEVELESSECAILLHLKHRKLKITSSVAMHIKEATFYPSFNRSVTSKVLVVSKVFSRSFYNKFTIEELC